MKRKFVIGDIHGAFRALKELIGKVEPRKEDEFIFLGDYTDAWSEAVEVIDFLLEFQQEYSCVFIRGNHDQLLLDYFEKGRAHEKWLKHGGQSSKDAYERRPEKVESHANFLRSLVNYHIDQENRLYVHGGFTNLKGVDQEWFDKLFYWDRTLWELACATPLELSKTDPLYPARLNLYKEVYIGHTPTLRLGKDVPIIRHSIFNIDTGGGFNSGKLTAFDVNSKSFIQSTKIKLFYSDEFGRTV
ncbi:metallophosphoesterase [Flavobacteriaceae bacterium]|nr:metallophosphoesterase [Flavobacteriaceae bacterium]